MCAFPLYNNVTPALSRLCHSHQLFREVLSEKMWWWLWLEQDTQDESYHLFGLCTQPDSHQWRCSSHGDQGLHLGRVQDGATVALRLV